jgi:hypothetical protein
MSSEQHVESLIDSSDAKDLVIQQTPHVEDESEVPRIGEGLLVLPVACRRRLREWALLLPHLHVSVGWKVGSPPP